VRADRDDCFRIVDNYGREQHVGFDEGRIKIISG
jgi:hypothetical protein